MDARKLIETKMEQFKVCEKETKTKTYSKEGLAREEQLTPEEQAKADAETFLQGCIDRLAVQIESQEADVERLSSGKGAKKNKVELEEKEAGIRKHRWHISKMEQVIRMINNDQVEVDQLEDAKEDLEYYIENNNDPDAMSGYEDMDPYEVFEMGAEEPEEPAPAPAPVVTKSMKGKGAAAEEDAKDKKKKDKKDKKALSSTIPITIGRAKVQPKAAEEEAKAAKAAKTATPVKAGSAAAAPPAAAGGATMANILLKDQQAAQAKDQQAKAAAAAQQQRQQQLLQQAAQAQAQQAQRQQAQLQQQQQQAQAQAQQRQLQQQQQQQQQQAAAAQQMQQREEKKKAEVSREARG